MWINTRLSVFDNPMQSSMKSGKNANPIGMDKDAEHLVDRRISLHSSAVLIAFIIDSK